jgi:nucleoside-diphosphate-sugar epimerase
MRYFVTGATGFIGGSLARQLIAAGHQVIALARDPAKAADLVKAGAEVVRGDVVEKESMRAPMGDCDGVFHVAAWYRVGVRNWRDAERINVEGTRHVLELMRELEIPKGVYTSTVAVFSDTGGRLVDEQYRHDGPWLSEYDRTKWRAHYEVALPMIGRGLPLVVVQPGVNYGPGDTSQLRGVFVQYLRRKLPILPAGVTYCWAHVDDTARGHIQAMECGRIGESYIIAGQPKSLVDVLKMAEEITGVPAPKLHPGPGMLRAAAGLMEAVGKIIPLPPDYAAETLRVMAGTTYLGNSAKAERELGFKVRPLEDGLRETLAHEMKLLGAQ